MPRARTPATVRRIAIEATDEYLAQLERGKRGRSRHDLRPEGDGLAYPIGNAFELRNALDYRTDRRLYLYEQMQVRFLPHGTQEELPCLVESYWARSGKLTLSFKADVFPRGRGTLEVDMRWLVQRHRKWLAEKGLGMASPFSKKRIDHPGDLSLPRDQAPEQKDAIRRALGAPLSYVQGVAGSGKTHRVLAGLAQVLVEREKQVLVVGPTNTSIENALTAIVGRQPDVRSRIARLGKPSPEFLGEFPDLCTDHAIQAELLRLRKEVDGLCAEMGRIEKLGRQGRRANEAHDRHEGLFRRLLELDQLLEKRLRERDSLLPELDQAEQALAHTSNEVAQAEAGVGSVTWWRGLVSSDREEAEARLRDARGREQGSRNALALLRQRQVISRRECKVLEGQRRGTASASDSAAAQSAGALEERELDVLRRQWSDLKKEATEKEEQLRAKAGLADLSDKCIVACTLDGLLSLFEGERLMSPDWVLLDEAPYAPLAKVLPLLTFKCPISMFGDRFQIGPVSEVAPESDTAALLWSESALALEQLWCEESLEPQVEPILKKTAVSLLKESFRFSDELVQILDHYVYRMGLRGQAGARTLIEVVGVIPQHGEEDARLGKRVNAAEADAIVDCVRNLQQQGEANIAVLTPYRNQLRTLNESLERAGLLDVDLLSVHRSQGREWDVVLLSVVDGTLPECSPHYTTSHRLAGRRVLTTALSRARKRLILVCEEDFWRRQSGELVGALVSMCGSSGAHSSPARVSRHTGRSG